MDERTEELRDLFVSVTDEEAVTESQAERRGSLADVDEDAADDRLRAVVDRMRDRYEFHTDLDADACCRLVRAFYDGADDDAIAEELGTDPETVFHARMDLHLLTESDTDFPFSLADLRARLDDEDPTDLAEALDADSDTVARAVRAARTRDEIRTVSQRFQSEFEDALPEAALSVSLTESVRDDGLDEAAEDIETDTKF